MLTIKEIRQLISEKVPEGLIVPAHTENAHYYRHTPSGKLFSSVTTFMQGIVANPNLQVWSAKLAVDNLVDKLITNRSLLDDNVAIEDLKKQSIRVHKDTFEDAGGIGTVGHKTVEEYNKEWIETGVRPTDIARFLVGKDVRESAILRSAIEFYNDYYYLPIVSELLVCNLKDGYAGTLDCLGAIIVPEKTTCSTVNKNATKHHGVEVKLDWDKHDFSWRTSSRDWTKVECAKCGMKAKYQIAVIDYKTSNHIKQKPTYCAQVAAYSKALKSMTGYKPSLHVIVRLDKYQPKYEAVKVPKIEEAYKNFKLMKALCPWVDPKIEHTEPLIKKEIIKI